jgi:hypothetical protein
MIQTQGSTFSRVGGRMIHRKIDRYLNFVRRPLLVTGQRSKENSSSIADEPS